MDTVGVMGAGLMGAHIAQTAGQPRMRVNLSDTSEEQAQTGLAKIARGLDLAPATDTITVEAREATIGLYTFDRGVETMAEAARVVEAASGGLGRRSGRGFYGYSGEGPVPVSLGKLLSAEGKRHDRTVRP